MSAASQTQQSNGVSPPRLVGLDYLRFLAAMAAVSFHYLYRGQINGTYLSMNFEPVSDHVRFAHFGVQLFFVISGFVIVWSAENKDWLGFARGRFVRLWPAYVFGMTLTALITVWYGREPFSTSLVQWLANLSFVAPAFGLDFMDGVYWTIVMELIFYFWIALLLMSGNFRKLLPGFCVAWMVLIVVNEFWFDSGVLRTVALTRYGAWFLSGIITYLIVSRGYALLHVLLLAVAVELTMAASILEQFELARDYGVQAQPISAAMANGVCLISFGVTIVFGRKFKDGWLPAALGGMTYPLYLIHQHIGYMFLSRLSESMNKWLAVALTMMLVLAMSWFIWRFWERAVAGHLNRLLKPMESKIGQIVNRIGIRKSAAVGS